MPDWREKAWLERALERDLHRVSAPDELWRRVVSRRTIRPRAGITMMAIAAMLVWGFFPRPAPDPRELALKALSAAPANLELTSGTLPEIRHWVSARTGFDVPLPARSAALVRVKGVCEVRGNIAVAYQVNGREAALVISKADVAPAGAARHQFLKCDSVAGKRISSWIMRGQLYTLAYATAGETRDECQLCHDTAVAN